MRPRLFAPLLVLVGCAATPLLTLELGRAGAPPLTDADLPRCSPEALVSSPGVTPLDATALLGAGVRSDSEPIVIRSAEELAATFPHAAERLAPIDFTADVLVVSGTPNGTPARLSAVLLRGAGTVLAVTLESFCGGTAPPTGPVGAVVPRENGAWAVLGACPDASGHACSGPPRP